jgi:hypothetical protein
VSGILGTVNIISSTNHGLSENRLYQKRKNIVNTLLIKPETVYLPPLQTKLGLTKNFIKTIYHNSAGFLNLKTKCPTRNNAKIKEGIFVGLKIRESVQDLNVKTS